MDNNPEGEKQEMLELYKSKGMADEDARLISETLSKHRDIWIDVMMTQELGILESEESPIKNGLITFTSFTIYGLIPLLPFIVARIAD